MRADSDDWLRFADADLAAARVLLADRELPARIACFHAQQAAEKALKALLIEAAIPHRQTHDLIVLQGLQTQPVAQELAQFDLLLLQPWAVDARYPGDLPDATHNEATEVVEVAARIVGMVRDQLEPGAR